jgi:Domain of unknown function (DUF4160)
MPTLLNRGFCRITVYSNDHRPAHVHAIGPNWEAVFELNYPDGPPTLRESFKLAPATFRKLAAAIRSHLVGLCKGWESIHGSH